MFLASLVYFVSQIPVLFYYHVAQESSLCVPFEGGKRGRKSTILSRAFIVINCMFNCSMTWKYLTVHVFHSRKLGSNIILNVFHKVGLEKEQSIFLKEAFVARGFCQVYQVDCQ